MACAKPIDPSKITDPKNPSIPKKGSIKKVKCDRPSLRDLPSKVQASKVQDILDNPNHSMHEKMRDKIVSYVSLNAALSTKQKEQVIKDSILALEVNPTGFGITKAATTRGQYTPIATPGKLGKGTGYPYEISGTASLIRNVSDPTEPNGSKLSITPGADKVFNGIKLQARYGVEKLQLPRKTVEADIIILKPDGREIAVDFKYVKSGRGYSDKHGKEKTLAGESDLAQQLMGVTNALRTGEIDEFHFATNGHFSKGFVEAVDRTNEQLSKEGHAEISLHHHVKSENM